MQDVHFIGFVAAQYGSEIHAPTGPVVDRAYLRASAQAHEHGGFDRVLIAFHSIAPDSFALAQYVASVTERIGLMIAHRPGFQAPTVATWSPCTSSRRAPTGAPEFTSSPAVTTRTWRRTATA